MKLFHLVLRNAMIDNFKGVIRSSPLPLITPTPNPFTPTPISHILSYNPFHSPVLYGYLVAAVGKSQGWGDCDVDHDGNLCSHGADMIRNPTHWATIKTHYTNFLNNMATVWSTSKPIIVLLEPDFIQYSERGSQRSIHGTQNNGGLTDADWVAKWKDLRNLVKGIYPNAKIGLDISPWFNDEMQQIFNLFGAADYDLTFVSGGRTTGSADQGTIRTDANNNLTWDQVYLWTNYKPILADSGYGVGGSSDGTMWYPYFDETNVKKLWAKGLRGVTIQRDGAETVSLHTNYVSPNRSKSCTSGDNNPYVEDLEPCPNPDHSPAYNCEQCTAGSGYLLSDCTKCKGTLSLSSGCTACTDTKYAAPGCTTCADAAGDINNGCNVPTPCPQGSNWIAPACTQCTNPSFLPEDDCKPKPGTGGGDMDIFDDCGFGFGTRYNGATLKTMSPRPTKATHFSMWADNWNLAGNWATVCFRAVVILIVKQSIMSCY